MKKILSMLLSPVLVTSLLYAKTMTDINFTNVPYTDGVNENAYGDKIMYQDVLINTKDFKIDNFWGKFSDSAQNQSNFTNISTAANVKLTIENSFTCKDGGLIADGCSGQKPFLINSGTLSNPDLKLDRLGAPLPAGEYRIPFDRAANYNVAHDDAFYALDIFRDAEYYKKPAAGDSVNSAKNKNFFAYITALLQDYFSKDTTIYGSDISSPEARDRYIANITFGLQKEYRIAKDDLISTNEVNTANSSKKISLLDYNSQIIENTTGCNGLFFSYDPDSLTCKSINFFGLSQWMPFINSTDSSPELKVKSDSVLEDTETTLLTLAGKLDKTNYIDAKTTLDPVTSKKSFIQEIFKPMSFMMSSMYRFFFGSNSSNLTEVVSANFDFVNPMPLTFIETDGIKALNFVYFELLGLESIYGTEVESCRVNQTKTFFFFPIGWDSKTFTKGVPTNTAFDVGNSYPDQYNELNITSTTSWFFFVPTTSYQVNISTDDWLDWCKRNQGRQTKGLFATFIDSFTSFIFSDVRNATYDGQLDTLITDNDWFVDVYKEKINKELILHLKNINIDSINLTTNGTSTKFAIMKTSRGHK